MNAFELFKDRGYLHRARKTRGYFQLLEVIDSLEPFLYENCITREILEKVAESWNTTVYNVQRNIKKVSERLEPNKDYVEFMLEMAYELKKENKKHGN